jgi:hypothetical protein
LNLFLKFEKSTKHLKTVVDIIIIKQFKQSWPALKERAFPQGCGKLQPFQGGRIK